mgnify:FL=1
MAANLPVKCELTDGYVEIRSSVSGDWRQVVRWLTIDKAAAPKKKKA